MKSFKQFFVEEHKASDLMPREGVQSLEEYLNTLVGMTIKEVLDKKSYLSMLMMNKHGMGGIPSGSDADIRDFARAVVDFVNRKITDHKPRMEDRSYNTQEFKDKHNFDEYEKLRQGTRINSLRIKHEQGVEAYERARQQISDARERMRNSEYGKAVQALDDQYEQALIKYWNTPMTKEYLADDGSPEYQKLEKIFNRLKAGQPAISEYERDGSNVIDV